jgi:hypothetical protein
LAQNTKQKKEKKDKDRCVYTKKERKKKEVGNVTSRASLASRSGAEATGQPTNENVRDFSIFAGAELRSGRLSF